MNEVSPKSGRVAWRDVWRVGFDEPGEYPDGVAVEEPLEIRVGFDLEGKPVRRPISITMRTPGHDEELALGFLFAEGIVREPGHVAGVGRCRGRGPDGAPAENVVRVDLTSSAPLDLEWLERKFVGTSSCGVCGKTTLDALRRRGLVPAPSDTPLVEADTLLRLPDLLREAQDVFEATGGLHAAAHFDAEGRLLCLREDVGRHNAVDKLVGRQLLRGELPAHRGVLLLSGRTSFEIVQKAIAAGFGVVAAVGAPSSLAVDMAREFGVTLVGFLRDGRFNVYSGRQRVAGPIAGARGG